jgi:hypothetical protein
MVIMKKNIVLAITAILLTCCMGSGSTSQVKEDNNGLIIFEQPEKVIETKSFKVFQVLDKGYALANGLSEPQYKWYNGPTYLIKDESHYFTDEEIVDVPKGKICRQVGVYTYSTRGGKILGTEIPSQEKTVAVIEIFKNEK